MSPSEYHALKPGELVILTEPPHDWPDAPLNTPCEVVQVQVSGENVCLLLPVKGRWWVRGSIVAHAYITRASCLAKRKQLLAELVAVEKHLVALQLANCDRLPIQDSKKYV